MGLYDRDYQRGGYYDRQPGFHLGGPVMMTTKLMIITAVVYLVQLLSHDWVTNQGILFSQWYRVPWQGYRLLTYGFLHSPNDLWHIVLNMFTFWLFGREVELRYGRREFVAFYLIAIVVAGLVWTIAELPNHRDAAMLGASGGVAAVVVLFALNFPHRTILFNLFIPMPMWLFAIIMVGLDALGTMNRSIPGFAPSGPIAFSAHLGGAAFAFLYFQSGWHLERLLPSGSLWKRFQPKPRLRVHDPETAEETDKMVDEILKKIQDQGRDSLTRRERRILEEASREYQKKRR